MGIEEAVDTFDSEMVEKHGQRMLDRYGEKACECASIIEDSPLASDTTGSYKPQIRQVISELGEEVPDPEDVAHVIKEQDKSASSKNVAVHALRAYYTAIDEAAKDQELAKVAKAEGIAQKDFDNSMEVDEWITVDEVEHIEEHILPDKGETSNLIEGPSKSWNITLEHKALMMSLFYTGCRVGEICAKETGDKALSIGDLYPDSGEIKLYRLKKSGKGYKRDMKVVPQKLWDVLDAYIEDRGIKSDDENIFPFVTRTAENRIDDIDGVYQHFFGGFDHMEKLSPHKFRHGRVTQLANANSLDEAGEYVEHSSKDVTAAYKHLTTDGQREMLPETDTGGSDSSEMDMEKRVEQMSEKEKEELLKMLASEV